MRMRLLQRQARVGVLGRDIDGPAEDLLGVPRLELVDVDARSLSASLKTPCGWSSRTKSPSITLPSIEDSLSTSP